MKRLTARNQKGLAYLVKVKENEQGVESSYPNTLRCIMECLNRLAELEDALESGKLIEVVRCKDCENYKNSSSGIKFCGIMDEWAENDGGYCSCGEKGEAK